MHKLNWGLLRYALYTYREGTVSAAAEKLNVTHATAIRSLKKLEEETQSTLFIKSTSGYVPTEIGRSLIETAQRIEIEVQEWQRSHQEVMSEPQGLLRVTTTQELMANTIAHILPEYYKKYPKVQVEFHTSYQFDNLNSGQFDVAIRSTFSPPEHLVGRPLSNVHWGLYRSGVAEAKEWVGYSDAQLPPAKWMQELFPKVRCISSASTVAGVLELVKQGLGRAILPCFVADNYSKLTLIERLPETNCTQLWLLYHKEIRKYPKVTSFVNWVYENIPRNF